MTNEVGILRTITATAVTFASFLVPSAQAQRVSVPATLHLQEHPLSCEIASLKMALKVHGIDVSESELISRLPFDGTPKQRGIWGDPHTGFVGNIDGRMLIDGYGVYWEPIAKLGGQYAHTQVLQHSSPHQLARFIQTGSPVIIWGHYGAGTPLSWQTLTGATIYAVNGEHTRVVYGFDGSVETPTRFYVLDPLTGRFAWSTDELLHNWRSFNNMAVVVAKHPLWVRAPHDTEIWELNATTKTRRHITTWDAFVRRGGSVSAVSPLAKEQLFKYTTGVPLN